MTTAIPAPMKASISLLFLSTSHFKDVRIGSTRGGDLKGELSFADLGKQGMG